jgi:xanthine dehydrogenase/oxidase
MPANYTWEQLVAKAFSLNLNLSTMYLQRPEENFKDLFNYDIDAAACSEVLIDVLTGETQILRTDILYDCGQTMNGLIDICQAEGGFVMGLGAFLLEKTIYDPETGKCLNNGTWFYKPPQPKDIPIDFRISFVKNKPNPLGYFGSKAIGEPPLHLSNSIVFALKHAISSARQDRGVHGYFKLEVPITIDKVQEACLLDSCAFVFKS